MPDLTIVFAPILEPDVRAIADKFLPAHFIERVQRGQKPVWVVDERANLVDHGQIAAHDQSS